MEDMAYFFERAVAERIEELRQEKGLTEEELGRAAWPHVADPRRKYHGVKNVSTKGKPQRLNMADFFCLAKALDRDPARIIGRALDMIESMPGEIIEIPTGTLGE